MGVTSNLIFAAANVIINVEKKNPGMFEKYIIYHMADDPIGERDQKAIAEITDKEDTLENILNSKFYITDSFHGVCLSIIFRKDFLVVPRDFHDRFNSLFNRLGLNYRIIKKDLSNLAEEHFAAINYDEVYGKLDVEIRRCRDLLKNNLQKKAISAMTDLEVAMSYIRILEATYQLSSE